MNLCRSCVVSLRHGHWAIGGTLDKSMTEQLGEFIIFTNIILGTNENHNQQRKASSSRKLSNAYNIRCAHDGSGSHYIFCHHFTLAIESRSRLSSRFLQTTNFLHDSTRSWRVISWNFISATLSTRLRHHQLSDLAKYYQRNHPR